MGPGVNPVMGAGCKMAWATAIRRRGLALYQGPYPLMVVGAAGFQGEAVGQPFGDAGRYEMGDVAAQPADLLDKTRGDELVAVGGHQEHRLDLGVQPRIHPG